MTDRPSRTALVTGGNSGIGFATARVLKDLGDTVIITGRRKEALEKAAAELGADVVKTAWPGDAAAFAKIVDACFVPVIVLGGAASDEAGILQMVYDSIQAGGAGIAIGRNVWQQPNPLLMLKKLHAIVHGGATAKEALAIG